MLILDKTTQKEDKPIYWKLEDHHYLTLWDKKDLPNVRKWQEKIRLTHDESLIYTFFDLMDRYHNDHKNNLAIEPLDLSKIDDIMTFKGLAKFCRLITLQENTGIGKFVSVGHGATSVFLPFNDSLISEDRTVEISTDGFFDAAGVSMRYGGTFGENTPTNTLTESLVRNTRSAGDSSKIVMCLNNFRNDPINHTQGNTGFTCAGTIEFTVIVD